MAWFQRRSVPDPFFLRSQPDRGGPYDLRKDVALYEQGVVKREQ